MATARARRTIADDAALSLSGRCRANLLPVPLMNILNRARMPKLGGPAEFIDRSLWRVYIF